MLQKVLHLANYEGWAAPGGYKWSRSDSIRGNPSRLVQSGRASESYQRLEWLQGEVEGGSWEKAESRRTARRSCLLALCPRAIAKGWRGLKAGSIAGAYPLTYLEPDSWSQNNCEWARRSERCFPGKNAPSRHAVGVPTEKRWLHSGCKTWGVCPGTRPGDN